MCKMKETEYRELFDMQSRVVDAWFYANLSDSICHLYNENETLEGEREWEHEKKAKWIKENWIKKTNLKHIQVFTLASSIKLNNPNSSIPFIARQQCDRCADERKNFLL
jgi:hypothetical protein